MCQVNAQVYYCYIDGIICKSTDGAKTFKKFFSDKQMLELIPAGANTVVRTIQYDADSDQLFFNRQLCTKWEKGKAIQYEARVFAIQNVNVKNDSAFVVHDFTKNIIAQQHKSGGCTGYQICKNDVDSNFIYVLQTWDEAAPQYYKLDKHTHQVIDTWLPKVPKELYSYDHFPCIYMHNSQGAVQYLCGYTCSKSVDSGRTFIASYSYSFGDNNIPHTDVRSMLVTKVSTDGLSDHILLGTDGGISFSNNGGKTFRNLNGANLPLTQFYGISVSPFSGNISGGSQDNSIMTLDAKQNKWIVAIRGDGYDVSYSKTKPGFGIGEYNYCAPAYTANDVAPFTNFMSAENERTNQFRNLFAREQLFVNKNGTPNWKATKGRPSLPDLITSLAVGGGDDEFMYVASRWQDEQKSVWRSTDGGNTWQNISRTKNVDSNEQVLGWHKIMALECAPNGKQVFASFGYFSDDYDMNNGKNRVWMSRNAGDNWQDISNGLPAVPAWDLLYHEASNYLFCCNALGVYALNLSAFILKWRKFGEGLPMSFCTELDMDIINNRLVLGTYGYGIWAADLPSTFLNTQTIKSGKFIIENDDSTASTTLQNLIVLKRNAQLIIRQPLYIGKDVFIQAKNKKQIIFEGRGKIVAVGKKEEECLLFQ
jgi:quinol monooxygenase YgiN